MRSWRSYWRRVDEDTARAVEGRWRIVAAGLECGLRWRGRKNGGDGEEEPVEYREHHFGRDELRNDFFFLLFFLFLKNSLPRKAFFAHLSVLPLRFSLLYSFLNFFFSCAFLFYLYPFTKALDVL